MSEVTGWFEGNISPVHIGVYERDYSEVFDSPKHYKYSFWNGTWWSNSRNAPATAAALKARGYGSCYSELPWRGLCEKAD